MQFDSLFLQKFSYFFQVS